jgi:hypothetical protein
VHLSRFTIEDTYFEWATAQERRRGLPPQVGIARVKALACTPVNVMPVMFSAAAPGFVNATGRDLLAPVFTVHQLHASVRSPLLAEQSSYGDRPDAGAILISIPERQEPAHACG